MKLCFLMRAYGLEGLRNRIRNHVTWATERATDLAEIPGLHSFTRPSLSLFSFAPADDIVTEALLTRTNDDGRVYLTQTRVKGQLTIRVQVGQFDCTREDVMMVAKVVHDLI